MGIASHSLIGADSEPIQTSGETVYRVRQARRDDLPEILKRWQELIAVHTAIDSRLYAIGPQGLASYRAFARKLIGEGIALVAVPPGPGIAVPVFGYILGMYAERAPVYVERDIGIIIDLAVAPAYRHMGIGSALVDAAFAEFRREGTDLIQVNYAPDNPPAVAFWTKRGFQPSLMEAYKRL